MMLIIFSVVKCFGGLFFKYVLLLVGVFVVMYVFVLLYLGLVVVVELFGVNIGLLLIVGLFVVILIWYLGVYLFGLYAGKKFDIFLLKVFFNIDVIIDEVKLFKFVMVMIILVLLVLLIFMDTGLNIFVVVGMIDGKVFVVEFLCMLGKILIVLLIILFVCIVVFVKDYGMVCLEKLCGDLFVFICVVILVTGVGGMFGGVLCVSGIGSVLVGVLLDTGMFVVVVVFVIVICLCVV